MTRGVVPIIMGIPPIIGAMAGICMAAFVSSVSVERGWTVFRRHRCCGLHLTAGGAATKKRHRAVDSSAQADSVSAGLNGGGGATRRKSIMR